MESLDEIYRSYANTVYQYLLSLTHNADVAEEVTQETFFQAVRSIHRYDGSCKITTWLCSIAKHQLLAYQRKHPTTESLDTEEKASIQSEANAAGVTFPSAESMVLDAEGKLSILKLLHHIKEPYREVFYLRVFGELSFKEIAEVFGKSENWARVTYYRAKEQLRKEMESHEI